MKKYPSLLFPNFRHKALTLSYDDGRISDKRLIELMAEYEVKGTFNLNSGLFGTDRRITEEEARDLYGKTENEIAVHGKKHLSLDRLTGEEIESEIIEDKNALEALFERSVTGMAYSYGAYNDEIVKILERLGICYARTVVETKDFRIPKDWLRLPATCHHNDPQLMSLAESFLKDNEKNEAKLFYLWGHSYEFDDRSNWSVIVEFFKKVGRKKDVWYATNGEIYRYVKAFRALKFSENDNVIFNDSDHDLWLNCDGKEMIVYAKSYL